jgi:glucokinase
MAVIALDLGGTKLSAALFNDKGDILFKTSHSLDKRQGTAVGESCFSSNK